MRRSPRGVVLVLVSFLLTLLLLVGMLLIHLSSAHRRQERISVDLTRATLLSRSGAERALAELSSGANPAYSGEDFNGDGVQSPLPSVETSSQRTRPIEFDIVTCPVVDALSPSFFSRRDAAWVAGRPLPDLTLVEGRQLSFSGRLRGAYVDRAALPGLPAVRGDVYVLKVEDESAKINVNGGFLDRQDRDGDGRWDDQDPNVLLASGESLGWNAQLTRILNVLGRAQEDATEDRDLDAVLDPDEDVNGNLTLDPGEDLNGNGLLDPSEDENKNGILERGDGLLQFGEDWNGNGRLDTPVGILGLGNLILENRPEGGYSSIRQLQERIGRPDQDLSPYLTVHSWADRKVVRPNAWAQVRIGTLGVPAERKKQLGALVVAEQGRSPVNLNAAPFPVLVALLEGISAPGEVINMNEAAISPAATFRLTRNQAVAIASQIVLRRAAVPFATWADFEAFLDGLVPGVINGFPTLVGGMTSAADQMGGADLIKANLDPNTRLNKELPDSILFRWIDKSDLLDYSTEGNFGPTGTFRVESLGRVTDAEGRRLAEAAIQTVTEVFRPYRETTQADFMAGRMPDGTPDSCLSLAGVGRTSGAGAPWRTWGGDPDLGVAVMSYPCPLSAVSVGNAAVFDGRLGLASVEMSHAVSGAPGIPAGSSISFLHHFDSDWAASVGANLARQSAPASASDPAWAPCDLMLTANERDSVWPSLGVEPNTLYPDGIHPQKLRCPAYSTANFPADAGSGDHAVLSHWIKRPYTMNRYTSVTLQFVEFSCMRYLGGMTQHMNVGRRWTTTLGSVIEPYLNDPGDPLLSERMCSTGNLVSPATDEMFGPNGLRWELITVLFDTDEVDGITPYTLPARDIHVTCKALSRTGFRAENYAYAPAYPPASRTSLMHSPDHLFVLGAQRLPEHTAQPAQESILDEFAVCDFLDIGAAAVVASDAWADERYSDGRYYKYPGAAFLSREILPAALGASAGPPQRLLRAQWTAHLPNQSKRDPLLRERFIDNRLVYSTAAADLRQPANCRLQIGLQLEDRDPTGAPRTTVMSQGGALALSTSRFRYRARFVTDLASPDNEPLLESPWLDDVTFYVQSGSGPRLLSWDAR